MNKSKKILIIGLVVSALLFAGALAFLVMKKTALSEARENLESELSTRSSLANSKIYPSEENLKRLTEEQKELQKLLDDTLGIISNRQVQAVAVTGTKFNDLLESTRKAIRQKAQAKQIAGTTESEEAETQTQTAVNVDNIISLDAKEYNAVFPKDEHAPRLTIQIKTLEMVIQSLIDSGVTAIVQCQREKFDVPASLPMGMDSSRATQSGGGVAANPADLESNSYTIAFQATEPIVWAAINNVQNLPIAPVLTKVSFSNQNKGLQFTAEAENTSGSSAQAANPLDALFAARAAQQAAQAAEGTPSAATDPLKVKKLMAGTEQVEATLSFKVYQVPQVTSTPRK